MVLDIGEKVHVIERRLFDADVRRHFIGVVDRVDTSAVRLTGYVFVYNSMASAYVRGSRQRSRVIPLAATGFVINVIPSDTSIEDVQYREQDGRLTATDGGAFNLDINEFGGSR